MAAALARDGLIQVRKVTGPEKSGLGGRSGWVFFLSLTLLVLLFSKPSTLALTVVLPVPVVDITVNPLHIKFVPHKYVLKSQSFSLCFDALFVFKIFKNVFLISHFITYLSEKGSWLSFLSGEIPQLFLVCL